jgi:hypothetical protein
MSEPPGEPQIDVSSLLESPAHIDDAGFTARVVRALPPGRRRRGRSHAIILAFTALGCALGGALGGPAPGVGGSPLSLSLLMTTTPLLGFVLALALVASSAFLSAEE